MKKKMTNKSKITINNQYNHNNKSINRIVINKIKIIAKKKYKTQLT